MSLIIRIFVGNTAEVDLPYCAIIYYGSWEISDTVGSARKTF
jgi:hypothetical protein